MRRSIRGKSYNAIIFAAFFLIAIFSFSPFSFAQEFTAATIGDFGDITVMEVEGNYDDLTAEGTTNSIPRQVIAKEFFKLHPDQYDFFVIFSNFDFAMHSDAVAFYLGVRNDVQGIGIDLFDHSGLYGSDGVLQGTIDMGNLAGISSDPLDPRFSFTMGTLSHELLHRWTAHVRFKDSNGETSTNLLGKDNAHWSFLLNTSGSLMYGNRWQDNGDGTFTSLPGRKYFSPLDLYLMGLIDKSEVEPMLLIQNPEIDPKQISRPGVTIEGTSIMVAIEDIVSAEGERIPSVENSQKKFKVACIFITRPGTFTGDELFPIRTIMKNWDLWLSSLTDGKASVILDTVDSYDIPENPGVEMPPYDPRSVPSEIDDGVAWLTAHQNTEGSWTDAAHTVQRDTAESLIALFSFPAAQDSVAAGLDWLDTIAAVNTDFLARKIDAFTVSGKDTAGLVNELLSRQNSDGGWGLATGYLSNAIDTALALKALVNAGASNTDAVDSAVDYLNSRQHSNGGWGMDDGESRIQTTTDSLQAFLHCPESEARDKLIQSGLSWLVAKQNTDGGFGNSPSTVYDTALALITLKAYGIASDSTGLGLDYLLNYQSRNGSWYESPYQTALAVEAILRSTIEPDLSLSPADVSFDPATVTTLPSDVTIRTVVRNSGITDVSDTVLALYKNAVSDENKIAEQVITVPGKSSVTATFTVTIQTGNTHRYFLVADPINQVAESFETNNTVIKTLYPETTHDFELLAGGLSVAPENPGLMEPVAIGAQIRNNGASDAYDVALKYSLEGDGRSVDILTANLDIPAGQTVEHQFEWIIDQWIPEATLVAVIDPFELFSEISETNNSASVPLNATASTDPNLVVSHEDIVIDPEPAKEGGQTAITALIRNEGFAVAETVDVAFYLGTPGTDEELLDLQTVPFLPAGDSVQLSFVWEQIPASGDKIITISADPENLLQEISDEDNTGFKAVKILSLPDLSVSTGSFVMIPASPKEGDIVDVRVTIQNQGEQDIEGVPVRMMDGDSQIHSETLARVEGLSTAEIAFSFTPGQTGVHTLTVSVDPDDLFAEQNENNNIASKSFGLQDADLWLTETYISPNGDGIKDMTQFFFRLEEARSVTIEVVGKNGEAVRTFSGAEFENSAGGTVSWDGLKDDGTLTEDGTYWIRVISTAGEILASLPIIVDTNRSTLGDAVLADALLQSNLSCMLPDIEAYAWLPNESGIIYSVTESDENTSAYPAGFYSMAPDGEDVRRLVPWEWAIDETVHYEYGDFSLSPDGNKVAFVFEKFRKGVQNADTQELWCVDPDGSRLTSLVTLDHPQYGLQIKKLVWAPGGDYLAIIVRSEESEELRIVSSEGVENILVHSIVGNGSLIDTSVTWASDSARLAFAYTDQGITRIGVADSASGFSTSIVHEMTDTPARLDWLSDQQLVLRTDHSAPFSCWIVDTSGNGLHREVTEFDAADYMVHPAGHQFAFIQQGFSATLCDAQGYCRILYESDAQIYDLQWSSDGRRLSFFCEKYKEITPCLYESAFLMIGPDGADKTAIKAGYYIEAEEGDMYGKPFNSCGSKLEDYEPEYKNNRFSYRFGSLRWLGDETSLVAEEIDRGYLTASPHNERPVYLPIDSDSELGLSPHGRYITYTRRVDPESICYGSGSMDMWNLSSLLNLTADLRPMKRKSGIILNGTAADLHFDKYRLEYADIEEPALWQPVMPPSDIPVIDDTFTTWVPPYEGTFFVRLTVSDSAGNESWERKRVSWGIYSSITSLYKTGELFSPNGDGFKDSVELHYRVLEPVHLEFTVFNEQDDLIRTFYKDHNVALGSSELGHILWDGRDESGQVAPDGIYRIEVYDYQFFFEIDNTPPEVDLELSRLVDQLVQSPGTTYPDFEVHLSGHATDDNLKQWGIHYGEGDNPSQWYDFGEGRKAFTETDHQGEPTPVEIFRGGRIPFVTGKKFRIIAEDYAGNRRTVMTDYSDEILLLVSWEIPEELQENYNGEPYFPIPISTRISADKFCDEKSSTDNQIPGTIAEPGVHHFKSFHTIRSAIVSASIQYRIPKKNEDIPHDPFSNLEWIDHVEITEPISPGITEVEWDNSDLRFQEDIVAIRLKAYSETGEVYYSIPVNIGEWFQIYPCLEKNWKELPPGWEEMNFPLKGYCKNIPLIPGSQKTLVFSYKRADEDESAWQEYLAYNVALGDTIPVGLFPIPEIPDYVSGVVYDIKMAAGFEKILQDGSIQHSTCEISGPIECSDPTITVFYPKAVECGEGSPNLADIHPENIEPQFMPLPVHLFIQEADEFRFLKRFDKVTDQDFMRIDTSQFQEGVYPIKAVFDLGSGELDEQPSANNSIIVDRTPPEARITFPTESSVFCPVWIPIGDGGGWYAIDVEGRVADDTQVQRYELWYGIGPEPREWIQAQTRTQAGWIVPEFPDPDPYYSLILKGFEDGPMPLGIFGKGAKTGVLGRWDVSGLDGEQQYSLMLKVVDVTGNVTCHTTTFMMDRLIHLDIGVDKKLFSPNGDGILDQLEIGYQTWEYTAIDIRVLKGGKPVKTLFSGYPHVSGSESVFWDGTDDAGLSVPDGTYEVSITATDACQNVIEKSVSDIEVDNTPPTLSISYPQPGAVLGTIVEVTGTAFDKHFKNYRLTEAESQAILGFGSTPCEQETDVLGQWNTFGKEGVRNLVLTASDTVGNTSEITLTVSLDERMALITSLKANPGLISPNGDGLLDTAEITYGIDAPCNITLEFLSDNIPVHTVTAEQAAPGEYTLLWDGKKADGKPVSDGIVKVMLTARLSADPGIIQKEGVTLIVDTVPPSIAFLHPEADVFIKSASAAVIGSITDENMGGYTISCIGESGPIPVDAATQNRINYTFSVLDSLADGPYTLSAEAADLGENTSVAALPFIVDATPPRVKIETPVPNSVFGGNRPAVPILGKVEEENLDSYLLRWRPTNPGEEAKTLLTGDQPADPVESTLPVGKNDGIPDGDYLLSLSAKDQAGWESEAEVFVAVDNTPPDIEIVSLTQDRYIREPINIQGSVTDAHLKNYRVEYSEGECADAQKWIHLKTAEDAVTDGILTAVDVLPADGSYCLRVTASDQVGHTSEEKAAFQVDTHPPAPPVLSGKLENKTDAVLDWPQNTETDIAGYNLYRDKRKINAEGLIENLSHIDAKLKEGLYTYTLTAVDLAGWESEPSNTVKLKVDLTPPQANIRSPRDGSSVSDIVDIKGTAYSIDDFKEYRLYFGQGASPADWKMVRTSPVPTAYDTLFRWDTLEYSEGTYAFKLEAEDTSGNIGSHQITVVLDNTPPAPPVLVSAVADLSDVTLVWDPVADADLAGYLLFRNDRIATVEGTVIGDLTPYLVTGTTYTDTGLPDGIYTYYILAMDTAGNLSEPSSSKQVEIDLRTPEAFIVTPSHGEKFQNTLPIRAESEDFDIAEVRFQYKQLAGIEWIDIGDPVTSQTFTTFLDPERAGLVFGDYRLRAVATDRGGKTDPSPAEITVTYTDLIRPEPPNDLVAVVTGGDIALSWSPNAETDLAGYHIYQVSPGNFTRLNTALVTDTTYTLTDQTDAVYTFEITAVDTFENESDPSNQADATLFTPFIEQPYTPTLIQTLDMFGTDVETEGSFQAEVFHETDAQKISLGRFQPDTDGGFGFDAVLSMGENRFTAQAFDEAGNSSKTSPEVVVVFEEAPTAPTGFLADCSGYQCLLSWDPNPETDIAGYNLYRNGKAVNAPLPVTAGSISASYSSSYNRPSKAFDRNNSSHWYCYTSAWRPVWWEIEWNSPRMVNRLEIDWSGSPGADFEIQVWSGYAWITQETMAGNEASENVFEFSPSYVTDRIRIVLTAPRYIRMGEVRIWEDNLIQTLSLEDFDIPDGEYSYELSAVDRYGFESPLSEPISVAVGDISAPESPVQLDAEAVGADVNLTWSPSPDPDVAGYHVYRQAEEEWNRLTDAVHPDAVYTDPGLVNGTYTYRVTAVDAAGNESSPSNEASAVVDLPLPDFPVNPVVTVVPEGMALEICWNMPAEPPAGYNLYRSRSGQQYELVNEEPLTDTCYRDQPLENDLTYHYVVVSLDAVGNESSYSETAEGTPHDSIAPPAPDLFAPTVPGLPVETRSDTAVVLGWAEPGAAVRLFQGELEVGTATASAEDQAEMFPVSESSVNEIVMSPDSRTVAMVYGDFSYGTALEDVATGRFTRVAAETENLAWSPDGKRIAYIVYEDSRIQIYDLDTTARSYLTEDSSAYETDPFWSADSRKMVFVSNRSGQRDVWIRDLSSKTMRRVTDGISSPSCPQLSPDGEQVAFLSGWPAVLYAVDADGWEPVPVADRVYRSDNCRDQFSWSPDGGRIGFISDMNGEDRIYIADTTTWTPTAVESGPDPVRAFRWSPDGKKMVFITGNYQKQVSILPVDGSEDPRLIARHESYELSGLDWTDRGRIQYWNGDDENYQVLLSNGFFRCDDVRLHPGDNDFHATAVDDTGNESPSSEAITVIYRADPLPDPAVSAGDIILSPPAPVAGDEVLVNLIVRNEGQAAAEQVEVRVYLWNAAGDTELIRTEILPYIGSDSNTALRFNWDSTGQAGRNDLIVSVDADDRIEEVSETNNTASAEFFVAREEGVTLMVGTDFMHYNAHEDVGIDIAIYNSGPPVEGVLETRIADENGIEVTSLNALTARLAYAASADYDMAWNTGITFAGNYTVHSVFKSGGNIIAEGRADFAIDPDIDLSAEIFTDKLRYRTNQTVLSELHLVHNGENAPVPALKVHLKILDQEGDQRHDAVHRVDTMMPASSVALSSSWDTGLNAAGQYHAVGEVYLDDEKIAIAKQPFHIDADITLRGTLKAIPETVPFGSPVRTLYSVVHAGNEPVADLPLSVTLIDPDTLENIGTNQTVADLETGGTAEGEFTFAHSGDAMKTYKAVLQYRDSEGEAHTLSTAFYTLKDLTGPVITVESPAAESELRCGGGFAVSVTDNASGIDTVEYRIGEDSWTLMPLADPSAGLYAVSWTPSGTEFGTYLLRFRAVDRSGNESVSPDIPVNYVSPIDGLTGTIAAEPDTLFKGETVVAAYTVANDCPEAVENLPVRISIKEAASTEVLETVETLVSLAGDTQVSDHIEFDTLNWRPGSYQAVIEVLPAETGEVKTLATAGFEVLPGLEVDVVFEAPVSLLVWINDGCKAARDPSASDKNRRCRSGCGPSFKDCIRTDLLAAILDQAGIDYQIVFDRSNFTQEMRNPLYTDILILGDHHPLTDHIGEELTELVFSGTGLISSLWMEHGNGRPSPFGVRFKGKLADKAPLVHFLDGFPFEAGYVPTTGKANRIEAKPNAQVAGWIEDGDTPCNSCQNWAHPFPAVVLNEYGDGATVYHAFDLGRTLTEANIVRMADIITGSLEYVHRTGEADGFHPGMLIPVTVELKSLGGDFDLSISETFPPEFELYDPDSGAWTLNSPWTAELHLASETVHNRVFYFRADAPGTYTVETEIGIEIDGAYTVFEHINSEIVVGSDAPGLTDEIIARLNALSVWQSDWWKVRNTIRHLEKLRRREIRDLRDIRKNIHNLMQAFHSLRMVDTADISEIRLQMGRLLRMQQSLYYDFNGGVSGAVSADLRTESDPAAAGEDVLFHYSLYNLGSDDFGDFSLRLDVIVPTTGALLDTLTEPVILPAHGVIEGTLSIPAAPDWAGECRAELWADASLLTDPVQLAEAAFQVNVSAQPPIADAGGPYISAVGEAIEVDGSGSWDPNAGGSESGGPPFDFISHFEWERKMSGYLPEFDDAQGEFASLPGYPDPGAYELALRVTDNTAEAFSGSGLPDLTGEDTAELAVYTVGVGSIRITPQKRRIRLDWARNGARNYTVLRSESGPNQGFIQIGTARKPSYTDRDIVRYADYWYRIWTETRGETNLSPAFHIYTD